MRRLGILLMISLLGCASTRMTSQLNPEFSQQTFSKVLVHANFQSLEARQLAEEKICAELNALPECECVKSSDAFFPGREFSPEEVSARLAELAVDGVLTLEPTGSGSTSQYVPKSSTTTGNAQISGNTVRGSSTTTEYGGYNVSKPWASYEASLIATEDGETAWYATAATGGNAYANWKDLVRSAAGKTVSQLRADGAVR